MGRSSAEGRTATRLKQPKGIKHYVDRTGKARFYHRASGTALPGLPWSPQFMEAYEKAVADHKAAGPIVIGASRTLAGTVNAGLVAYFQSTAWTNDLGASTRVARRNLLERFRNEHGDKR